jgi:hypothetical protein
MFRKTKKGIGLVNVAKNMTVDIYLHATDVLSYVAYWGIEIPLFKIFSAKNLIPHDTSSRKSLRIWYNNMADGTWKILAVPITCKLFPVYVLVAAKMLPNKKFFYTLPRLFGVLNWNLHIGYAFAFLTFWNFFIIKELAINQCML